MIKLVLGCDIPGNTPLWNEGSVLTHSLPISLSRDLRERLLDWNERMACAVAASADGQDTSFDKLNKEGVSLARAVEQEHANVQIRYLPE